MKTIRNYLLLLGVLTLFIVAGCIKIDYGDQPYTLTFDELRDGTPPVVEQPASLPPEAVQQEMLCPEGTQDYDGDGICSFLDCNDNDPAINQYMPEQCDLADNNCNGMIDEGCTPAAPAGTSACLDQCTPAGEYCAAGSDVLKQCRNVNDDPCLELVETRCTYGCDGRTCRIAPAALVEEKYVFTRPSQRQTQDEAIRTPMYTISAEPCQGRFIGTLEWNEDGSLCRRHRFEDASTGYLTPESCCNRFYSQVYCVQDRGEIPYQAAGLSFKYHEIGCYSSSSSSDAASS